MRERIKHWRMKGTSSVDGPGSFNMKPKKVAFAKKMRANPTGPERAAEAILRGLDLRFKRQVLIYGYIADFYIPEVGLVVEADGPIHLARTNYDAVRDMRLRAHDIETIRLTSDQIATSPALCARDVMKLVEQRRKKWIKPSPKPRARIRKFKPDPTRPPVPRQPAQRGKFTCRSCTAGYASAVERDTHVVARHPRLALSMVL